MFFSFTQAHSAWREVIKWQGKKRVNDERLREKKRMLEALKLEVRHLVHVNKALDRKVETSLAKHDKMRYKYEMVQTLAQCAVVPSATQCVRPSSKRLS